MIRDPSDGSVREKPVVGKSQTTEPPVISAETSGLPAPSTKTKYQARLEASREWLKEYHASKDPEKTMRLMGEQGE